MKAKRKMKISKKEFIERVSNTKVEYLKCVEAYFDALIECDFDKANKVGATLMTVMDPEIEAYIAKNSYEQENYDEFNEAYRNFVNDSRSFLN